MKKTKTLIFTILTIITLQNCAPSAKFLRFDEQREEKPILALDVNDISIFPVLTGSPQDSIRIVNMAFGLAEKFEKDRNLSNESISVYAIPINEFSQIDNDTTAKDYKTYSFELYDKTGAQNQIYLNNLKLGKYTVEKYPYIDVYEIFIVSIPYNIDIAIYNPLLDSLYYSKTTRGSINIQVDETSIVKRI